MNRSMLQFFGLSFDPSSNNAPVNSLYISPSVHSFCNRISLGLSDGGFALATGEPGSGKSVLLRILADQLSSRQDLTVAKIDHPQSKPADFYRELADCFGVQMSVYNRWKGFQNLRERWSEHMATCRTRPVLIIDEAQQMLDPVFTELRILASKEFDSQSLLTVVFAGDARLTARFRHPDMIPLGTRIRRRIHLDYAPRDELLECLAHLLPRAGNAGLVTKQLQETLVDHAAGNYRVLMNSLNELLNAAFERQVPVLDEKLFLETFAPVRKANPRKAKS